MMPCYTDLCKRLRNRRICIQATGGLDDYPLLEEAAEAIEDLLAACNQLGEQWQEATHSAYDIQKQFENELELAEQRAGRLLAEIPKWVSVEERLPDEVGMYLVYVHAYGNVKNEAFYQETGCDGSYIDYLEFDDRQKVWQNGQYDAYNAVLSAVDKDRSYYISHWMMPPKKPEEDCH